MQYVKINKIILFLIFLIFFFIISLYALYILKSTPYYLFVVYIYIFSIAYFFYKDIKLEATLFYKTVFFFIAVILISWGQHVFSFFDHQRIAEGTIFFVIGIIFLIFSYNKNADPYMALKEKNNKFVYEKFFVFLLLILSFIARAYNLEKFFPGVWYDEAQNGFETLRLMDSKEVEFFITRYTYMPSMFFYISSVFIKIFGFNIISLRLVSAFLGTLSVIAFYFLLKEIFKNWLIAIFGALIYSFSRWNLNFSRIAFLGILTVLLLTLFAYFYLKSINTNKKIFLISAGVCLGLTHYTYSVAYFIHFLILLHFLYLFIKNYKLFLKEKLKIYFLLYLIAIFISLPLIVYAIKNPALFFQRANDISFFGEIKNSQSLTPLIKNIESYLLSFNFEGDYNGRHNIYKKPLFDYLTGIFFVIGFIYSLLTPRFRFFVLWLIIMYIPGIISISIETPQFYRIIGAMPAVFIIVILGITKSIGVLNLIIKNKKFVYSIYLITAIFIISMNIYQYYFLYPKEEGTYLSFSPEATRIGKFINEKKDYLVIVSPAKNMYGFYQWEQKVICDFMTYKKTDYKNLIDSMVVYRAELDYLKKKGIAVILRPTDTKEIEKIEKQYSNKFVKEEYKNPFNNEPIFYCYYIDKNDIIVSKDENLIIRME